MTRAERYRRELLENVIPFWMRHSVDQEHGGFFTCLDRDGQIYDRRKYVWLNGRQVWTLAKLYRAVEPRQEWLEAAQQGAEFLRKNVYDAEGRCYFAVQADGAPAAYQRKPYGAVFVMLGLLELSKATNDATLRAEAEGLFRKVRTWIADPTLLGRPSFGEPASQLADIYVLAFMALELAEDTPDLPLMRDCLRGVKAHLQKGVLLETATDLATPEGRLFCPGSSFEIAWILLRLLDYSPDAGMEQWLLDVVAQTMTYWQEGFPYFVDIAGHPTLQLESSQRLWWVHVEALVALATAYDRTGDRRWLSWFDQVDEYTWRHFRDERNREWFGYLDKSGVPELTLKGNHYKGCFHIPRALLYCSEIFFRHAL
ncbi:MAG: AGE family epimerase/isomerase [Bryobacteraceae bacterium]|nr:AGE family epimerase/isomerase [Bryobacteraceae bacterium]